MKSLIITFLFTLVTTTAVKSQAALPTCIGEAQFAAEPAYTKKNGPNSCRLFIKNVSHYSEHIFCPLSLSEVMEHGIEIGMRNGHDCEYDYPQVSGIIVKRAEGLLYLD